MKDDSKDVNEPQAVTKVTLLCKEMEEETNRFLERMAELAKRLEQVDE